MEKLVFLAIAGVFLVACQVSAYTHSVFNLTPYTVTVSMRYAVCKDDTFELKPSGYRNNEAGLCILKGVSVTKVVKDGKDITNSKIIHNHSAGFIGSENWKIVEEENNVIRVKGPADDPSYVRQQSGY